MQCDEQRLSVLLDFVGAHSFDAFEAGGIGGAGLGDGLKGFIVADAVGGELAFFGRLGAHAAQPLESAEDFRVGLHRDIGGVFGGRSAEAGSFAAIAITTIAISNAAVAIAAVG